MEYDALGNIISVTVGTNTTSYEYDDLNQLTRENNPAGNYTYTWTYDSAGNILSRKKYAYTTSKDLGDPTDTVEYNYDGSNTGWKDLLTKVDDHTFNYDDIGNPLEYYDGRQFDMEWTEGRRLSKLTCDGKGTQYQYNADGIRTKKTRADGTRVEYILADGRAVGEITYSAAGSAVGYMKYAFDETGAPTGFSLWDNSGNTWVHYYLVKNLQGDVAAVYSRDTSEQVATYTYDSWGNILTSEGAMAEINPFRYRGYYYDAETGFYYVSSRYYDPAIGRFISPDTTDVLTVAPMSLTGKNLFAYCDNNPVVRVDRGGDFWDTIFDVISLGASIVEVCVNPKDPWAWAGLAGDAIDLIPFVTGVGEVTRAVKTIDRVADTVQITKAVDFTEDAADIVKTLDRSSGFTKSTASAGRKIHQGYKATNNFPKMGKEFGGIKGIRPDYVDFDNRIIYELKPMNPRGVRNGIRQLQRYNKALGGGFKMQLELY